MEGSHFMRCDVTQLELNIHRITSFLLFSLTLVPSVGIVDFETNSMQFVHIEIQDFIGFFKI